MKDQLVFDTAGVRDDQDTVGAFLTSSDGTLLTHTTDGSKERLDVNTELGKAEDSAHVSGDVGAMALAVRDDAGGSLVDTDGDYTPLSVDSSGALRVNATVNIDSQSDKAEDSAHASGDVGEFILSVRMDDVDGSNSALLAGTEGDYQGVFTNAKGEVHTRDNDSVDLLTTIDADTSIIAALSKAEDSVHVSGDTGVMGLAVRNDAGTPLAADGDYVPLMVNDQGSLYTHITGSDPLTVNDAALANIAVKANKNTLTLAGTPDSTVVSILPGRKYLWIYNADNQSMEIGEAGFTPGNGFPIGSRSYMELRVGANIDVEFDSTKNGHEIRTLEAS